MARRSLNAMIYAMFNIGMWQDERGVNMLDGGAHFYDTYETSDGKWVSIGSIEPQFYALLLEKLGLSDDPDFAQQMRPSAVAAAQGPARGDLPDQNPRRMVRDHGRYRHLLRAGAQPGRSAARIRTTLRAAPIIEVDGVIQPAPAPRFSATPAPPVRMQGCADYFGW